MMRDTGKGWIEKKGHDGKKRKTVTNRTKSAKEKQARKDGRTDYAGEKRLSAEEQKKSRGGTSGRGAVIARTSVPNGGGE